MTTISSTTAVRKIKADKRSRRRENIQIRGQNAADLGLYFVEKVQRMFLRIGLADNTAKKYVTRAMKSCCGYAQRYGAHANVLHYIHDTTDA